MTSLQGYVKIDYDRLVEILGEPTYDEPSGDGKVNTEWEILDDDCGIITIYDWKECCAETARTTPLYRWHIGGRDRRAVDVIREKLNKVVYYA
jgi:hypothetical protein